MKPRPNRRNSRVWFSFLTEATARKRADLRFVRQVPGRHVPQSRSVGCLVLSRQPLPPVSHRQISSHHCLANVKNQGIAMVLTSVLLFSALQMKSIIIAMFSFRSYWKHYPISNYFMTSDDYTRGELLSFFIFAKTRLQQYPFTLVNIASTNFLWLSMSIVQASYQMLTFGWKTFWARSVLSLRNW